MKAGARPAAGSKYRSIIINPLRREMICEGIMTREKGVYTRADAYTKNPETQRAAGLWLFTYRQNRKNRSTS